MLKDAEENAGNIVFMRDPTRGGLATTLNEIVEDISIDDLTWDNGIENKHHKQFSLPSFFCNPHSPWQKPHVENGIGLIRRWFVPKGTNLNKVSEEKYQQYLNILNHKYRRSLGYKSAYEVALERGIIQKIPDRVSGN